jgi:hypothetical protein
MTKKKVQVAKRRREGIITTIKFLMKEDTPSFRCTVEGLEKAKDLLTIMEGDMKRVFDEWENHCDIKNDRQESK